MLIKNQKVKTKWQTTTREYYENRGYKFTKYCDEFEVNINDLPLGSGITVRVICDFCGKEYTTSFAHYNEKKSDILKGDCCHSCRVRKRWAHNEEERREYLFNKVSKKCSEHGYILITPKSQIHNYNTYINYICPKHGEYSMKINNMISGRTCPDCAKEQASKRIRLSKEEVVNRIRKCGGQILNVDEYVNQDIKNLRITCPNCKNEFITQLNHFTQHGGQVCKECSAYAETIGERRIRKFLESKQIDYRQEYWFDDCRDVKPLPFDFYIPDKNIVIEFDGQQHFVDNHFFGNVRLGYIKSHDEIKQNYCLNNGIRLIRIPYYRMDKIETILTNELNLT